jgi:hypothetical protein
MERISDSLSINIFRPNYSNMKINNCFYEFTSYFRFVSIISRLEVFLPCLIPPCDTSKNNCIKIVWAIITATVINNNNKSYNMKIIFACGKFQAYLFVPPN